MWGLSFLKIVRVVGKSMSVFEKREEGKRSSRQLWSGGLLLNVLMRRFVMNCWVGVSVMYRAKVLVKSINEMLSKGM